MHPLNEVLAFVMRSLFRGVAIQTCEQCKKWNELKIEKTSQQIKKIKEYFGSGHTEGKRKDLIVVLFFAIEVHSLLAFWQEEVEQEANSLIDSASGCELPPASSSARRTSGMAASNSWSTEYSAKTVAQSKAKAKRKITFAIF